MNTYKREEEIYYRVMAKFRLVNDPRSLDEIQANPIYNCPPGSTRIPTLEEAVEILNSVREGRTCSCFWIEQITVTTETKRLNI